MQTTSILAFLEQLRAIAQSGLHHATNPCDQDRYRRLFELSLSQYAGLTGIGLEELRANFLRESGVVTPKTASCAAIFSEAGELLLVRRVGNGRLTLPGGACEPGESPQETAERETREETGLTVAAHGVVDVFTGRAGTYNRAVTIHCTMCYCTIVSGEMGPSDETTEVGFRDYRSVQDDQWHQDIELWAERAYCFWLSHVNPRGPSVAVRPE